MSGSFRMNPNISALMAAVAVQDLPSVTDTVVIGDPRSSLNAPKFDVGPSAYLGREGMKRDVMALARRCGWQGKSYRKAARYVRRLNEAKRQAHIARLWRVGSDET